MLIRNTWRFRLKQKFKMAQNISRMVPKITSATGKVGEIYN